MSVFSYISIFFIFFLYSCSYTSKQNDIYTRFEVKHGFDIIFDSGASKTVEFYSHSGSTIINGSYFGIHSSGTFFPAGLFILGSQKLSGPIFDDPNITHAVIIDRRNRSHIKIVPNNQLPEDFSGDNFDAFQAGPLVLSGNILQSFSDSWHAYGNHERTLLGKTRNGNIYLFVFHKKVSLDKVGKIILKDFSHDPIDLINLDGGPSTSYFDGKNGFRQNQKLPILFRITPI